MSSFHRLTAAALTTGAVFAVTACGSSGSDDFADQSVKEIVDSAQKAMLSLDTVRLTGEVTTDGDKIGIDLAVAKSGDCKGTVEVQGGEAQIMAVDGEEYLKGNEAFWKAVAGADAEQVMSVIGDRWTKAEQGANEFTEFCDLDNFLDEIDDEDAGKSDKKGKTGDVDGKEAVSITSDDDGDVSTVWVATEGKHYILKIESKGGDEPGTMTFSDFDKPVGATKPAAEDVFDANNPS